MKRKRCTKCKKKKLLTKFAFRKNRNRLNSQCRDCTNLIHQIWKIKNPEKVKVSNKKYVTNNWEQLKKILNQNNKEYVKGHPWYKTYTHIWHRCNDKNHSAYPRYGGRGIKTFLKHNDLKYLWFRDKAYEMKKPSIDRKNPDGHYTLKNCRYIELSENCKNHR